MNETMNGTTGDDVLYGGDGDDLLDGRAGHDTLYGWEGNDTLNGGAGNDVLNGGRGNDSLDGGYGSDTYVFARSDGADTIDDFVLLGSNEHNIIQFTDINPGDIDFVYLSGWDWVIGYGGLGDQITLANAELRHYNGVQAMHFADGTVWDRSDLDARLLGIPIDGDDGDDWMHGSHRNDVLRGDKGNDTLFGNDGDDSLYGGNADDSLYGGSGDDVLNGGQGNDVLMGNNGSDTYVFARSDGADTIYDFVLWGSNEHNIIQFTDINPADIDSVHLSGSEWSDWVIGYGGQGDQITLLYAELYAWGYDYGVQAVHFADGTIWDRSDLNARILGQMGDGSDSDDWVDGSHRSDVLRGGKGHDRLSGQGGNDLLNGGSGNDLLLGDDGNDTLIGGSGDDTLVGGAGLDTASYAGAKQGVKVDLKITTAQKTGQGRDVLSEVENLIGSAFADQLTGDAGGNRLDGGKGDDTLSGGAGHDTLIGGSGLDLLKGGSGNDWLDGGSGADTLIGGGGADTLVGGSGSDVFIFTNAGDSGLDPAQRDLIVDFQRGLDKIDLTAIDARTGVDGHQAFTKLSVGAGFNGTLTGAGVLYYDSVEQVLYGSVKSNGVADFAIGFGGVLPELGLSDFIL